MDNLQFQVRKDDFFTTRLLTDSTPAGVVNGEILLQVEQFAYTANNITYAVAADMIGYWHFYPAIGAEATAWGVIPVWGFARVVQSSVEAISVGERVFGYLPPASFIKMQPQRVSTERFVDGTAHRAALPAVYNLYRRVDHEAGYDPATDRERMLLFPLHLTAFCLWDALQDADWHGAKQVLVLSASSKTSTGFGYAVRAGSHSPRLIGMTSPRNLATTEGLRVYDQTITYDAVDQIDPDLPTVIVDMSGNSRVLAALHLHLGDNMKFTSKVGLTHWTDNPDQAGIIEERSEWFFAPQHIRKRLEDWGPAGFEEKSARFLGEAAAKTKAWLTFEHVDGLQGLAAVHADVCRGLRPPDEGLIVSL